MLFRSDKGQGQGPGQVERPRGGLRGRRSLIAPVPAAVPKLLNLSVSLSLSELPQSPTANRLDLSWGFVFPLPSVIRHLSSNLTPMPLVPGLLSPYEAVRGFVYLPRLVSKIRLHAAGQLHADFVNNLGKAFDDRCCQYLGIKYDDLRVWVLQNPVATQDEVLAWAEAKGRKLSTNEIEIWNGFMTKRGWRDEANEVLARRLKENGLTAEAGVDTMFDYIEVDEGRPARKAAL